MWLESILAELNYAYHMKTHIINTLIQQAIQIEYAHLKVDSILSICCVKMKFGYLN